MARLKAGRTDVQGRPSGRLVVRPSNRQVRLSVRPSGRTTIGPSGPITQTQRPPLSSTSTPSSPLTPMPPRRFELVGLGLDLRRCYAAAGHLSELGWRLICVSRTLVSSEACPDVDIPVKVWPWPCACLCDFGRARALEGVRMDVRAGGAGATPLAGL